MMVIEAPGHAVEPVQSARVRSDPHAAAAILVLQRKETAPYQGNASKTAGVICQGRNAKPPETSVPGGFADFD
jgi:hypothetical protein